MNNPLPVFTPREIVSELDRYIVSQDKAKRAVAIALRNRWRRQRVPDDLRDEIAPKNILMIGPTGVGKTEIARRLARLGQAPFLKVEASKFTEVGYVGRDVESMIRDLTELGVASTKAKEARNVEATAARLAEDRVLDLLSPSTSDDDEEDDELEPAHGYFAVGPDGATQHTRPMDAGDRDALRERLRSGELDEEFVTLQTTDRNSPMLEIISSSGVEEMFFNMKDMLGNAAGGLPGGRSKKEKKVRVPEALRILTAEESSKLVDMDKVMERAMERVQQAGIIFLDEIDKIAGRSSGRTGGSGPDVSRGGVQRDLLPIVEGTSVNTKYGVVKTDHILFIAAGAFHEAEVGDLIPELQGRFPIRVELEPLGEPEFLRILTEPRNSLIRQYEALLETENVKLTFSEDALASIAHVAYEANTRLENIGARRLQTVMETLLEEISFHAPELTDRNVHIDAAYVDERLSRVLEDEDLSRYIL